MCSCFFLKMDVIIKQEGTTNHIWSQSLIYKSLINQEGSLSFLLAHKLSYGWNKEYWINKSTKVLLVIKFLVHIIKYVKGNWSNVRRNVLSTHYSSVQGVFPVDKDFGWIITLIYLKLDSVRAMKPIRTVWSYDRTNFRGEKRNRQATKEEIS